MRFLLFAHPIYRKRTQCLRRVCTSIRADGNHPEFTRFTPSPPPTDKSLPTLHNSDPFCTYGPRGDDFDKEKLGELDCSLCWKRKKRNCNVYVRQNEILEVDVIEKQSPDCMRYGISINVMPIKNLQFKTCDTICKICILPTSCMEFNFLL